MPSGAAQNSSWTNTAAWSSRVRAQSSCDDGDVETRLASAVHLIDAVYEQPYLAHAPMEPNNGMHDATTGHRGLGADGVAGVHPHVCCECGEIDPSRFM
jgi:hypothetical protein